MSDEKNKPLSTDDIDELFSKGTLPSESEIAFNKDAEQYRTKIWNDIKSAGYSINSFADECFLQHSHLYDFLNGKKQLSRDRLLVVFLNLNYSYDEICKMLRRFQLPLLYPKNRRDYLILTGIHQKMTADKIDHELEKNGFSALCPEKPGKH